jgi:vacuolar-type H+-ATPase subunit E/Vma4
MIIVRLKVKPKTELTEGFWKEKAKGVRDVYGKPFRIIKLRWLWSRTNLCTNYQKTAGFDDAILTKDSNSGGIKVLYRPGALMWLRPAGGIGDFESDCPLTEKNLRALAKAYPNKRWYIVDDDIRAKVKAMWENTWNKMTPAEQERNTKLYRSMHTAAVEMGEQGSGDAAQIAMDRAEIEEQRRELEAREQGLTQREAAVETVVTEAVEKEVGDILAGVETTQPEYTREYLETLKLPRLRSIAKELNAGALPTDTTVSIIDKILANLKEPEPEQKGLGD